jgi:hypothetical protein
MYRLVVFKGLLLIQAITSAILVLAWSSVGVRVCWPQSNSVAGNGIGFVLKLWRGGTGWGGAGAGGGKRFAEDGLTSEDKENMSSKTFPSRGLQGGWPEVQDWGIVIDGEMPWENWE